MSLEIPKFLVKYWIKENKSPGPPTLKHAIFYLEETMINELRKIKGNYFIFCIGEPYKSKEYFDKMFAEEKLEKERQEFERLKQKFKDEG